MVPVGAITSELESKWYIARLMPEIGGKLASFRSRRSGFEFLWQPPSAQYPRPEYGQEYAPEFATGFDECFPTILACRLTDAAGDTVEAPDHGEVWSLPWQYREQADGLALAVEGRRFAYRLEKTLSVEDDGALLFAYRLTNLGHGSMRWLWSAHPLFCVTPGMLIAVPGRPAMSVYQSRRRALGAPGSRHQWPYAGQRDQIDLSLPAQRRPAAEKVFLSGLGEGRVTVRYPETGEGVSIEFPPDAVTALGLWYNIHGWPEGEPHLNAGIEPCSEPCESLADATRVLGAGAVATWWMRWRLFDWAPAGPR